MRYARPATFAFSALLALGVLVACGGGGGSGSNPPPANVTAPNNPQAPNPPGATTPPSGSTTPPSTSTTPPSGSTTPPSKSTTPPSTSTTPPSTSTTPPSTSTTAPGTASTQTISIGYGQTNGSTPSPLLISKASNTQGYQGGGNYEPEGVNGQQGATSAGGGQGNTVDGIQCTSTMSNFYHIHIFVGVINNGHEVPVPAGVGMVNPNPPDQSVDNGVVVTPSPGATTDPNAVPNQSWTVGPGGCYYDMHVHDNSGMIHIETSSNGDCGAWTNGDTTGDTPPQNQIACGKAPWTLQTFFDIWGIAVTASQFGPLQGTVQVYTTPPGYNAYTACPSNFQIVSTPCYTMSTSYQATTLAQAEQMALYSHTVFWFVVGSPGQYTTANSLPNINWEEGNP